MNVTYEELEKIRQKLVNMFWTVTIFFIIFAVVSLFILPYLAVAAFPLWAFTFLLLSAKDKEEYILKYKSYFAVESLNKSFKNVIYDPKKGIEESIIANTNMMNMGTEFESYDFLQASYNDVEFCQSDVYITEVTTDSDGDKTTLVLFSGKWMIFNFNKDFKANIQVASKKFGNDTLGAECDNVKYKKINTESELFNKKYNVYSQIEHDAFYVLTPSIIDKFNNLYDHYKGNIMFCFIDGKLHIAIDNSYGAFSPPSFLKKIDEQESFKKVNMQIDEIISLIDELSLNNDLFK